MKPKIIQVGKVLVSSEVLTECFCCDLPVCKGRCCVEGVAGPPVTPAEVEAIRPCVDAVWNELSASAQSVIDRQGISYTDEDGDLDVSIVGGKDCVFTCYEDDVCLCALEKAFHNDCIQWVKPISCALYPLREKDLGQGLVGLAYSRWKICRGGVRKGKELNLPLYRFLKQPLIRRFGESWYAELCETARQLDLLEQTRRKKHWGW